MSHASKINVVSSYPYTPTPIYDTDHKVSAADKATQIRHLALIGIAASDTGNNLKDLDHAFESLFEVIAGLADEVHFELEG